jgi:hypothetical protein
MKVAEKTHAKAAAKSRRNWTDEERLHDEFSKLSDQLERVYSRGHMVTDRISPHGLPVKGIASNLTYIRSVNKT